MLTILYILESSKNREYWWLRSPGEVSYTAAQTFNNGLGYYTGDFVNNGAFFECRLIGEIK